MSHGTWTYSVCLVGRMSFLDKGYKVKKPCDDEMLLYCRAGTCSKGVIFSCKPECPCTPTSKKINTQKSHLRLCCLSKEDCGGGISCRGIACCCIAYMFNRLSMVCCATACLKSNRDRPVHTSSRLSTNSSLQYIQLLVGDAKVPSECY